MEDPDGDLEVLTRAVALTIKQLADPARPEDQKEVLEKTTTGLVIYVSIFGKNIFQNPPD